MVFHYDYSFHFASGQKLTIRERRPHTRHSDRVSNDFSVGTSYANIVRTRYVALRLQYNDFFDSGKESAWEFTLFHLNSSFYSIKGIYFSAR